MGSDRKPLVPYRFFLIAEYFKPKIRLYYKRIFKDKIALKELVCEVVDDFTDLNLLCFFNSNTHSDGLICKSVYFEII